MEYLNTELDSLKSDSEVMLSVRKISKRFNNKQVLADVSFDVKKGSIFALIGPNGAGKTTTIRCILKAIDADSGIVEFMGEKINAVTKRKIAAVSEDRQVFRNFTAYDYERLYSSVYPQWDGEVFNRLVAKYNFDFSQRVETYSIGMKTLFLVVLAISTNAELLILDEPTQHLDPTVRYEVMRLIKEYASSGKSCIVSSHEMFELEEYATEFAIINAGKVIYTDSIDSAKEKHRVFRAGESIGTGDIIGIVGDEILVRVSGEVTESGRFPKFQEIVVGYLTGKK
ncbi:ATP-binding cassette domain-containing protein [Fervidobacterium islandicum]|uniref:ATP-binding cassette domain-containing protein n=1 Tax=Fervidobacterium islandicum TaxID=2423 RepID=A0AAI8CNN9_FERIS|nr:ATP-binding cassette domain-containing protein [Fervidobacterium islandicum]AMW33735.2 ATP-binding cassette domain-containing protein [Fervidobacterium islandicum]